MKKFRITFSNKTSVECQAASKEAAELWALNKYNSLMFTVEEL